MSQLDNRAPGKTPSFDPAALPLFCDFSCTHARFVQEDAVGACRREVGVFCSILNTYVNKHAKCQVRKNPGTRHQGGAWSPDDEIPQRAK